MQPHRIAPVFAVSDLTASLRYYQDVLGFSHDFEFGNYAGVRLENVGLHLAETADRTVGQGIAYIFCDDIDDYCAEIKKKGASLRYEPKDWPYGMREFMAIDPDGNQLAFGCETKKVSVTPGLPPQ